MEKPKNRTMVRTYSELIALPTFEERFQYLRLDGLVGVDTFGFDRIFNQQFYRSKEWKRLRQQVILRDNGCDLAMDGYTIYGRIIVHHLNPITMEDIESLSAYLLNPEFLVCTTHKTHNAIHYGDESQIEPLSIERSKNDTCPWKK